MIRILLAAGLLLLSACATTRSPVGPDGEPPSAGSYNPISGTRSRG